MSLYALNLLIVYNFYSIYKLFTFSLPTFGDNKTNTRSLCMLRCHFDYTEIDFSNLLLIFCWADISAFFILILENEYFRFLMH